MARSAVTPQPRGLVLDLLATLRTGSMPVRALVAAGDLFGIDENRMRVAITRALTEGVIERDQRGEYRRRSDRGIGELVVGWRGLDARTTSWSGEWLGVLHAGARGADRSVQRRSKHALDLLGFRAFQRDVAIRPANLIDALPELRTRLVDLGLSSHASVVVIEQMDSEGETRARELWDTDALRRSYARAIARLDASRSRLDRLSEAKAMVESFSLGGQVIRQIVLDPRLPAPLMPAGEFSALVKAMRAYECAGRASWRRFLERHGVDFEHAPALEARDTARLEHALGGFA
jgi:phenylacetic acid degradation operon negative regulatory protein